MVKEGLVIVPVGAWLANTVLFIVGVYFIDRARSDSRLFDKDVYQMRIKKIKSFLASRFGKSRLINS
jgi:lipopolysaccharide export system permease protein